jgi:acetyl-CoA carboxylase biotin carboxyl carrier protein
MTVDQIKELIRTVRDTSIVELEVRCGETQFRIRSAFLSPQAGTALSRAPTGAGPAAEAAVVASSAIAAAPDVIVKSPTVGTFHDAPSPGAAPFVKHGGRVERKQIICMIESLKLMNKIEAEVAGTIVAKHVVNGRPVEYGASLFSIRPR